MNKPIRTYEDLVREKEQLQVLLKAQKELLVYDLEALKEELQPVSVALGFIGKITTRDKSNLLLTEGLNKLIDVLFRKVILSRAGWLTRLAVPFFVKNYSSHFIADHKDEFILKILTWFNHKNGKSAPEQPETEQAPQPAI